MNNKKGQTLVIGLVSAIVLLGLTGIVVDASKMFLDINKLQGIADHSAVAGASILNDGTTAATNKAIEITAANGISNSDVTITTPYSITADPGNPRYEASDLNYDSTDLLRVQIQATHNYTFGKIFGLDTRAITVTSIGVNPGDIQSVGGVTPLGVGDEPYVIGNTYDIKGESGGGSSDDGPIRLGGNGASVWRDNMKYGYDGTVSIGAIVDTEPGAMSGPTDESVNYLISQDPTGTFESHSNTSPRVVVVLVCDPDPRELTGHTTVTVLGYKLFWLENVGENASINAKYIGDAKPGSWGQSIVYGENGSYTRIIR